MFVNTNLVVLAAALSLVVAQGSPNVPPCVIQCATQALSGSGCTSIASSCVCTDTKFQQASAQCLALKCSASDQAAALALQKSICGGTSASSGPSQTSVTTESSTGTGSSAASGSSSTSSGSSSSPSSSASSGSSRGSSTSSGSSSSPSSSGSSASSGSSSGSKPSSGSSGSGSGTSSASGSSSSKSNAAGAKVEFGQVGFITLGIAAAGAVVGGLLV